MITPPLRLSNTITITTIITVIVGILVGFLAVQGQITPLVLTVGGFAIFLTILKWPAFAAFLIAAFIPLEGVIIVSGHSLVKLIAFLALGMLAVREVATHKGIKIDKVSILILVLLGWGFITILWSPNPKDSLSAWVEWSLQCSLYIILINLILSKRDFKLVLWGFVLGGLLLSIILINDVLVGEFIRTIEVAGFGINLAARYASLTVLISILVYQLEPRRLLKMLLLTTIVIAIVGVVVSLSRGAWYSLAISIVAFILISGLRRDIHINFTRLFLWLLVILGSIYLLSVFFSNERAILKLTERLQSSIIFQDDASGRFGIWEIGIDMLLDVPVWGHGYNSFAIEFLDYISQSDYSGYFSPFQSKTSHNTFISILVELGLIGLFLFVAILILVLEKIYRGYKQNQANYLTLAWALPLFVFLIMASTVDNALDRKYFWFTLSLIILVVQYMGKGQTKTLNE